MAIMPRGAQTDARQQRLAAKLRENLRRRKKQAEARKPDDPVRPKLRPDPEPDR